MKLLNQILLLMIVAIIISSCKKDEIKTPALTSLTVGNFKISGKAVKLGSNATTVANNNTNGTQMALLAGENNLYFWPVGDSLRPYFVQNKFITQDREVYSLFLCGDTLSQDGILIKENIPYRTDSTAGIRFINLSPNSTPLSITLSTSPTVNEVSNLAYKQYTEFRSYPGLYNSTYTFQIRDASTQSPLAPRTTFSLTASTVPRFANITVVIRGMVAGTPALGTTRVNQDR
jgi:hypothetical protein